MLINRIVFLQLILLSLTAALTQAAPTTEMAIRGNLFDCLKGKAIEVRGIDVYAYELPAATSLYDEIQRLETLRSRADDGGAAEFFAAYSRMEKIVTSGKFPAKHTISDSHGRFFINHLSSEHEYLILAIGLKIEDAGAYYNFQKMTLRGQTNKITIWMVPDERRNCSDATGPTNMAGGNP